MGAPTACLDDELDLAVLSDRRDLADDRDRSDRGADDRPVIGARELRSRSSVVATWSIERPIPGAPGPSRGPARPSVRTLGSEWPPAARPAPRPTSTPPRSHPGLESRPVPVARRRDAPAPVVVRRARRRVVAGLGLLTAIVLGITALSAVTGDGPPRTGTERPEPVASVAYVVRAGDTLWSIAREIQPQGDVRPLVDVLSAERHGAPLEPGDVVAWPPLPSAR